MCYRYQQRRTSWLYANEQCKLLGGQLATIDGSSLNDFLYKNYRKPIYRNVWIGFKKCGTKWCHPDGKRSMYYKWNTGEPNNVGRNENCVEMWGNGYWNDAPCRNLGPSICEIPGIILSYLYQLKCKFCYCKDKITCWGYCCGHFEKLHVFASVISCV